MDRFPGVKSIPQLVLLINIILPSSFLGSNSNS
jgi:hypothetical protein